MELIFFKVKRMLNMKHVLMAGVLWTTIVYAVCFMGVALFPNVRPLFMEYALHTAIDMGQAIVSFTNFITGLVIWDLLAALGLALFVFVYNSIKE